MNLEPIGKYFNTDAPLLCKCLTCGNTPSPTFTAIRAGIGCKYCSGKFTSREKAWEVARKAGLEPLEDFNNGHTPWKCRHLVCGTTIFPLFSTLLKGGSGCRVCNVKAARERYKFPEKQAVRIMRDAGFQPLEPYVNAVTPWQSQCLKCKSVVFPRLSNVQNGSGCSECTEFGFKRLGPAYVYLMFHFELNSLKVGIGGSSGKVDRIDSHREFGWELYRKMDFPSGSLAYQLEQDVLSWLRLELGLGIHLVSEQMPQGGHTETVDASEIDLPTVWAKVEDLSGELRDSK